MAKPKAPPIQLDPRYETMLKAETAALKKKFTKPKPGKEFHFARLIEQAARSKVVIDLLYEDLSLNGFVELFSQSPTTPPYERERPSARLYATFDKNYQGLLKQLDGLSIDEALIVEADPLEEFLR